MKKIYFFILGLLVFSQSTYAQIPTMTCPGDVTVNNAIGSCGEIVTYTTPTCATNCTGAIITQTDVSGLTFGSAFPLDTTVQEYTITNGTGTSTCTFMIIVVDAENPTFSPPCPNNLTLNSDPGLCGTSTTYIRPKGIDNCGVPVTAQTDGSGLSAGSFFPVGITTQTYITTDTAGNTASCSFTITVVDVEAPSFSSCVTPQTFNNAIGTCDTTAVYIAPVGADNCSSFTVTQIDASGLTNGGLFPVGSTFQEFSIVDAAGNVGTSTCLIEIIVTDIEVPTVNCAGTQSEFADANCGITVGDYTATLTVSDNCDANPTITQSPAPGTVVSGITTVTLTATDASGNASSCPFNLLVVDTISPTITCPTNQNVSATSSCQAILGDYTGMAVMLDNCDSNPVATQSPPVGTTITTSQIVTLTATDASGNTATCSFLITVDDALAPTISCPSNQTVYLDGNCNFVLPDYTGMITVTDNCDSNPIILQVPAPGTSVPGGAPQFVSFSATDISGNVSFCSFLMTFVDTIAPLITCPSNQTDYLNNNCEFTTLDYSSLVTGVDNCGGAVFFTQAPLANTLFTGTSTPIVITYTAQDALGNTSTCSFNINISDTITPILTNCANDTIITADANCEYTIADFTGFISATDNCSSVSGATQSVAVGTVLPAGGSYPVVLSVSDNFSNTTTCSFNISVVDLTAPTLTCPSNPNVPANNNCEYLIPSYDATLNITDNCSSFTYTQSVTAGTSIIGIGTQQAVSIFVTDLAGNNNSCSFTLTIVDTTAPTIICPSDQTLDLNTLCQYVLPDFSNLVTATDFCDASPSIFQSPGINITLSGINQIIMTVQDVSGNTTTCTFNALPNDTIAPVIICPNSDSSCSSIMTYSTPIGSDDCGIATTVQSDVTGFGSGSTFPVGTTTLAYTVTDEIGNTSTCTFDITVFDPVVIFAGTSVLIEEGGSVTIDASVTNGGNYVWTPDYNMNSDTVLNPTVSPAQKTYYVLTTQSPNGCFGIDSVLIAVNTIDSLIINNFLSPNGDFSNDFWTVNKTSLISGCWVSIYNRWGKIVWESNTYENDWNGVNKKGEELPEGTYFYIIKCAQDEYKGSVLLMR